MAIQTFALPYSESAVQDLRERLARTRWPDTIPRSHWDYGVSLDYMKEICRYWKDEFDWKRQIEKMAASHHYRYTSQGVGIHFIHERGKGPASIPLILTHGWPSSFLEMLKIIPMLADPAGSGANPADAFDVIVPSLPGYGFSDCPTESGVNTFRIAEIWMDLMEELGYGRLAAQGGDWGADVTTLLGLRHPVRIIEINLNSIPPYQPYVEPGTVLSESEQSFLEEATPWYEMSGAYDHIQKTAPQTVAYGLNDSPAGLAAWILEKFRDWSDCDGDIECRFTKDELLSNITLYWMTQTIHSSCRLYYEDNRTPLHFQKGEYVTVPCGIALFSERDGPLPLRRWVERGFNIQHWTEMSRGGHFPALEEPELLVEDIRTFFRPLRPNSPNLGHRLGGPEIMQTNVFLQAALNGNRIHSAAPRTPAAIADAARAAVEAGAQSVHVHAFDDAGRETLDGAACAKVLRAIRTLCPETPISLTTSATIVEDPRKRFRIVEAWEEMPDFVTANQGETGIVELCELLLSRGVGIEAGLLSFEDARAFVLSGLAGWCRRVLMEPLDADPDVAVQHAAEMEDIVVSAGITLEQVHHGYCIACWAVNRCGLERGHGIRTGLEDVTLLPDGKQARDNADLVAAAAHLIRAHVRPSLL